MTEFAPLIFTFLRTYRCIIIVSIGQIQLGYAYLPYLDRRTVNLPGSSFRKGVASKYSSVKWRRKAHFSELRVALSDVNIGLVHLYAVNRAHRYMESVFGSVF